MLNEELLNQIFIKRQEDVEENIHEEYHKKVKEINTKDQEERDNIKMSIISELYYKQGFKDGINYIINHMKKN